MAQSIVRTQSGNSGARMTITLFGQWAEAIKAMNALSPTIKAAALEAQMEFLEKVKKAVKAHIRNQDLGWRPLNTYYAEARASAGLGGDILNAFGNYYKNIQVWKQGSQHLAFIGVKKGIYTRSLNGKKSKFDLAKIAYMNEIGGRKLRARPLWGPTIKEFGGARGIQNEFVELLHKKLRRRGIPVDKFTHNRIFNTKKWK